MKKLLLVIGVLAVSVALALYIHRVRKGYVPVEAVPEAGPSASAAPSVPASAPSVAASAQPGPSWEPVEKMAEAEGSWADPCSPERRLNTQCGVSLTIESRETAEKRDKRYTGLYPWKLELQSPDGRDPLWCGFQGGLQAAPETAPFEESWRVGFCKGGKLGDYLQAQRVVLSFKGEDRSTLRIRVAHTEATLFRIR